MKRRTTNEFIEDAIKVHNGKWRYDKTDLNHRDEKGRVIITCPIHGDFLQKPSEHLKGRGCRKCGRKIVARKLRNGESFFEKCKQKYNGYYSYENSQYVSMFTDMVVTCVKHGDFLIKPHDHLKGNGGCKECKKEKIGNLWKSNTKDFILKYKEKFGNRYDTSKVNYIGARENVCMICHKHGEFWNTPNRLLNGVGCPKCKMSHLEFEIDKFLTDNGIDHRYDVRDLKCLNGLTLDFYIDEYNIGIECQGIQHFMDSRQRKCRDVIKRDKIKKRLCDENGIKLLYYSNLNIEYPYEVITDKNNLLNIIKSYEK